MIIVNCKKYTLNEAFSLFSEKIDETFHYCGSTLIEIVDFDTRKTSATLMVCYDEKLGYYLNYETDVNGTRQTLLSLHNSELLNEVIEYDEDCLASAGLFVPTENALPEILHFLKTGTILKKIEWITPDSVPIDGNW